MEKATLKEKLVEGLRREYASFFQPMEEELYAANVSFQDPLISFSGVDAYRNNVDMLSGRTLLGRLCFSDSGLVLHNVREIQGGLETRWTLQFRFKLLPWKPLAQFTGVSRYTLEPNTQRVLRQQDYWDSVNLQSGGDYAPAPLWKGLLDLLRQLAPRATGAQQAAERELPYQMLRRTTERDGRPAYEVRRYPQHVAVATDYFRRTDGFGTLGAYTEYANEAQEKVLQYVPSLISVPKDERSLEQLKEDSYNGVLPDEPKTMQWPLRVPTLGESAPPMPTRGCRLEVVNTRTVAVLRFSEPTTEPIVRSYSNLLRQALETDGLVPDLGRDPAEAFRLAQFDALNSFGARRSEIWIDLAPGHPWEST